MKRGILTIILAVGSLCLLPAKESNLSFRFGAKGGLSFTNVHMSGGYKHDGYRSEHFGVFTEVMNKNIFHFFLRGSIHYSQRGVEYQNQRTRNKYIEIPIQLGYKLPLVKNISAYALAGPSLHFRTYGNGYIKGFPSERWNTRKVGTGVDAGIGVELFKHFQIEAQYQQGITPDYKSNTNSAHNQSILVSLGLVF